MLLAFSIFCHFRMDGGKKDQIGEDSRGVKKEIGARPVSLSRVLYPANFYKSPIDASPSNQDIAFNAINRRHIKIACSLILVIGFVCLDTINNNTLVLAPECATTG
jgi:hypothetical protein